MPTRDIARSILLLSLCCATSSLAATLRSPLEQASAVQHQLRSVVEQSCGSVFAVTAFLQPVSDPDLYQQNIAGTHFVEIADQVQRSCGTAFAIDGEGYLLTNEHVISGATSVWVTTDQGQTLPALVVGTDPRGDLAVLRIPAKPRAIEFAGLSTAARGDIVVAIGNPGGISSAGQLAASAGCISATSRALPTLSAREHRFYSDLLQITTPITTGSSGGPLLDLSGQAIGMVCAVVPNDASEQNIGFAIALSPAVRTRVNQLKHGEETLYGYVGVNVSAATAHMTGPMSTFKSEAFVDRTEVSGDHAATPVAQCQAITGARIDHIDSGTPASGILEVGDVVLRFDGKPIRSDVDFIRFAGACDVARDVSMTILRQDETIEVKIRPRRRTLPIDPISAATQTFSWAGVSFANDVQGVKVTDVMAGAVTPLQLGAVLTSINGQPVGNLVDLVDVLHANAGRALQIELLPQD